MADDDTTTLEAEPPVADDAPPPDADAPTPDAEAPQALPAGPDPIREARYTRLILPIALPLGAAVLVAVFVLNVSRVLLAAGSNGAVVMGIALIVVILGGAAAISAAPRLRTSSLVMLLSGGLIVITTAGLIAAPASVEKTATTASNGPVNPAGPAKATLEVHALPILKFNADQYTVPAGIVNIHYISDGGTHTLAIDDPKYASFLLNVPPVANGKVLLKPGSYTIYCTIPGHRAAGMHAVVTVQ
jgi:plastocyanin